MRDFKWCRSPRSTWGTALATLSCASLLQIAHAQTGVAPAAPTTPKPSGTAPSGTAPSGSTAAPAPSGTTPAPSPSASAPGSAGAVAPAAGAVAPAAEAAGTVAPPPEPTTPPPEPATPPPEPVVPPPVVLESEPAPNEPPPEKGAGPFARGSVRLTLLLGTGSTSTDQYFILGAGVGYYLLDGLEVGLDYEAWLFGDPVMHRLSPETRYVFHMVPVLKPYIGAFYRHTFVNDYDDLDYVGGRLGAFIVPKSGRFYFGAGAVYERLLDCKTDGFVDCDTVYPEIAIGIALSP
jgi:hypothetical protein